MEKIIRKATEKDVNAIYKIEVDTFDEPWSKKSIKMQIVDDELSDVYVAEIDGIIAAYIGYMKIFDEMHIANVAVRSDFRGRKISNDLFDVVTKIADNENFKMTLEVNKKNEIAINLYRKYGFKIVGDRKNYYGIDQDAYIMWRE
ncbi:MULTISPECIES: ribosomal protein S18-alanine N-acetyltransferase [Peptoniphilus]|jgi:ribosomal-protein-alanine acetyltransferase|uniref:ribosomal protein S18-alanine N-acetyltransferase n=1 Tax=Peptoniphilus TaxID=162289 RepID=UPI000288D83B|nr:MULTISPECIES: ribosomal protein S18-alanine N-acetyltransferase [Peptoniphilus]MBS6610164.1 ribosomal protein S18-alanine N-acetyltransferase [Peptoniphilus harei]MDU1043344.1 ribosomal protein S18-alanine N-acetyltransferase [Peptoniphilus rhinitidis]MDU1954060.1 ribosomal protein S18-alanine N-acetyltransferase [Peptoniphilus lacydonensis]MDU2109558.1 ribosomal protein S18-alanine N-acetyltransferase [Peptoniphilus lacydonensis]MDU2115299.1 ribosomal protein S18-alanine N-acetyltransferas